MKIKLAQNNIVNNQKRFVLNATIIFTVLCFSGFVLLNLRRGTYSLAFIEIICITLALTIFWVNQKFQNDKIFTYSSFSFLLLACGLYLVALTLPFTSDNVYIWIFIITPFIYFLLGKRIAIDFVSIFSSLSFVALCYYIWPRVENFIAFMNIIICHILVWFVSHLYESGNLIVKEELASLSVHDTLTNLYNREILSEIYRQNENVKVLTVVVIDIDFFKKINDKYGHDGGDKTLIFFTKKLTNFFEDIGYIVRMGGEEFCVFLPNIELQEVTKLSEEFLNTLRNTTIEYKEHRFNITFSAGLSQYPKEANSYSELLIKADHRLYQAKNFGRNQVVAVD